MYIVPLFLITLVLLGVGLSNALINTVHGYDICLSNGMRFIKDPVKISKIDIFKCKDGKDVHCFDAYSKGEIECDLEKLKEEGVI